MARTDVRKISAVVGITAGVVLALWLLIPVVSTAICQIITAVGAAAAMVVAAATSGVVAGVTVAPAALYVVGGIVTAWGAVQAYSVVVNVTRSARKEPFVWSLPLLGIVAGFMIDVAKDFYPGERFVKALFSVLTGVFILVGGYLFSLRGLTWKCVGVLLQFAPPMIVLAVVLTESGGQDLAAELRNVSSRTWLAVGAVFFVAACTTTIAARHASGRHS